MTLTAPVGQPDDAALTAYYDANLDRYTQPAGKRLDYAWIHPGDAARYVWMPTKRNCAPPMKRARRSIVSLNGGWWNG